MFGLIVGAIIGVCCAIWVYPGTNIGVMIAIIVVFALVGCGTTLQQNEKERHEKNVENLLEDIKNKKDE